MYYTVCILCKINSNDNSVTRDKEEGKRHAYICKFSHYFYSCIMVYKEYILIVEGKSDGFKNVHYKCCSNHKNMSRVDTKQTRGMGSLKVS